MSDFPRDDLFRTMSLEASRFELRDDGDGDGRTMTGFPVVFNRWTEINGWEGQFLERIAPSALTRTLQDRADQVKVLFNHGLDPSIGEKPLGRANVMDVRDDGLYVEVPLARTSYNDDLLELMRTGALDGMSFRFSVTREEWDDDPARSDVNPDQLPERTITELRLYEFGPVTFPAYAATTVGVRSKEAFELVRDRFTQTESAGSAQEGIPADEDDAAPAEATVAQPAVHQRKVNAMRLGARLDTIADIAVRKQTRKGLHQHE